MKNQTRFRKILHSSRQRATQGFVILALLLPACSGGDDDDDDTGDLGTPSPDGPCALAERVGTFEVAHRELYSAVSGNVTDEVIPLTVLQEHEIEGDCVLLRKENPVCDPPCTGGDACTHAGECIPYPTQESVGAVTVTGLVSELTLEPNAANGYDQETESPPFEAGSPIWLVAEGDQLEGFELSGYGVAPLVVPDPTWLIVEGDPLEITWTAADGEGEILATFNVDQHGNSPVTMHCLLEDTGSATIPASLLQTLIDYGLSGAANGHLYRRTADSTQIAEGCVELLVLSHIQTDLSVDGFVGE